MREKGKERIGRLATNVKEVIARMAYGLEEKFEITTMI